MKRYHELSSGQRKWVDLVEILFPAIYDRGIITAKELKNVDAKFREMRETDKRYKVSWPIWLIMNNAIERGIYSIPRDIPEKDEDVNHEFYSEYHQMLKTFGVIADNGKAVI